MPKVKQEADGWLYFSCPETGEGLYDMPDKTFAVRHKRNPLRTEFEFDCPSCEERHTMTFTVR